MVENPTSTPAEVAAYGEDGARRSWLHAKGGPVRHIDILQTLAIGSALILAIGTTACASAEESEPATVQATTSTEASEGTADETSPAAEEEEDEETSEAEAE